MWPVRRHSALLAYVLLFVMAALSGPPQAFAVSSMKGWAWSTSARQARMSRRAPRMLRRAQGNPERTQREIGRVDRSRPDGKVEVYHFTSFEAAESIYEQKLFFVSCNATKDARCGCGLCGSALSGESNTAEDMAARNFGNVTKKSLRKSQCYFRITMDWELVFEGRTSDRSVLIIKPPNSSATQLRWSELGRVEGPFFTKGVPPAERQGEFACLGARKVAREGCKSFHHAQAAAIDLAVELRKRMGTHDTMVARLQRKAERATTGSRSRTRRPG